VPKTYHVEKIASLTNVAGKTGYLPAPTTNIGEDMGIKEPSYTAGGNAS
jgi:hypothetical protein